MSTLVIVDIDPVLESQLASRAAAHHRTIGEEARYLLHQAAIGAAPPRLDHGVTDLSRPEGESRLMPLDPASWQSQAMGWIQPWDPLG